MESGKVIENIIIFGGIGAMAYLLLKKKPIVEPKETTKIFLNGVEVKNKNYNEELAKLCAKSIGRVGNVQGAEWKTPSEDLLKKCYGVEELTEVTEPLVDRSVLDLSSAPNNDKDLYLYGFSKNRKMYYTPSGDLRANNCMELDLGLKNANNSLADYYKLSGMGLNEQYKTSIDFTKQLIIDLEAKFNKFNCRDKIEAVRTRSLIDIQSKSSIKAEESVLGKGFKEQKAYIILGSLVLLTGFYIIVKK
jgi:hypothetical protein